MKKIIVVLTTFLSTLCYAQEYDLGSIPVYSVELDTLTYQNGERKLSAILTEFNAELYVTKIGESQYYKVNVEDETLAVCSNPYRGGVSSNYYEIWLYKKNTGYVRVPELKHIAAGKYFLNLPYEESKKTSNATSNTTTSVTANSSYTVKNLDWQILGKVQAVSDIHTRRSGGEDDVIYDKETAFLLSAFDGDNLKYKLSIPRSGAKYDVYTNGSYNGAQIKWDMHGKYVWSIPSLSQMYTHRAGGYYFNLSEVSK